MDQAGDDRFAWHPEYQGRTREQVRDDLRREIGSDQRQYALALEAADERENDALKSIIALEKRWGHYDMGWAEADTADLAAQVVAFEWAREQRHELFPYAEYRESVAPAAPAAASGDAPWWAFWRR